MPAKASIGNTRQTSPRWALSPSTGYARLGFPPFLPLRLFRMYFIIFIPCRDEMSCVCVRAFIRGCAVRKKTSPLDVPTNSRVLSLRRAQTASQAAPPVPGGLRGIAGSLASPRRAGRSCPAPPAASHGAGRPHARTEPFPGRKSWQQAVVSRCSASLAPWHTAWIWQTGLQRKGSCCLFFKRQKALG